jgi:DNA replication initiation complex subunit (GINS family)
VVEEEDSVLSFNRLRKVEKQERRNEDLSSLENDFFLSAAQYLEDKEISGDRREYMNAKRLFKRIVSQRRQKVVKNARLSLKSDIQASELSLLPRETELFLSLKDDFEQHQQEIEEMMENGGTGRVPSVGTPPEQTQEEPEQTEETREGYESVLIKQDVPEFMGTDLESYGPFEQGEKVELPEENAEILKNRGSAETA